MLYNATKPSVEMLLREVLVSVLFLLYVSALFRVGGLEITPSNEDKIQQGYSRDSLSNFTEFAGNYGYPSEEHTVITEDGYILTIFRIPKGRKCRGPVRQPPVLLMHGLLQSSDSWLDAGPKAGLPFLLSDACYDLWVGNIRGNCYGRRHLRLNPDQDPEFWNFSTDEMGKYDLPAIIDYTLNYTGANKLNYVGYSQGGRMFFILCSEMPEYCKIIGVSIKLAPAVRLQHSRTTFSRLFTGYYSTIERYLSEPKELELLNRGGFVQNLVSFACKNYLLADTACREILTIIDSNSPGAIATQTMRILFEHFPAGTSVKNIVNYNQAFISTRFQKYDYGLTKNLELYGTPRPPQYNLTKATTPVVVIYGKNDYLVDSSDSVWLIEKLPNSVEGFVVNDSSWNHFDFSYSRNIKRLLFPKINEYLRKFSVNGTS